MPSQNLTCWVGGLFKHTKRVSFHTLGLRNNRTYAKHNTNIEGFRSACGPSLGPIRTTNDPVPDGVLADGAPKGDDDPDAAPTPAAAAAPRKPRTKIARPAQQPRGHVRPHHD